MAPGFLDLSTAAFRIFENFYRMVVADFSKLKVYTSRGKLLANGRQTKRLIISHTQSSEQKHI